MAQKTRVELKSFFETNDIPTEDQFVDLIDSVPNIADDVGGSPANILQGSRLFTVAEIKTLSSSPIDVIAAPGVNKGIEIIQASFQTIGGTTAYTGFTQFELITVGASKGQIVNIVMLQSIVLRTGIQVPFNINGTGNTQVIANTKVQALVRGGNPATGDFDMLVDFLYRIRTML